MREEGTFVDYEDNVSQGEHQGIYLFKPGDRNLIASDGTHLDKEYRVLYCEYKSNIVYISKNDSIYWNRLNLANCVLEKNLDISKPISVYLLIYPNDKKVSGRMTVREGLNIIFEADEKQKELLNYNRSATIYDSDKIGARIIGYGEISSFFNYEKGLWKVYPDPVEKSEEEEEQLAKKAETMEF